MRPQVRGHPDHDGWLGSVNNNGFSTDQAHADSRQPSPAPRLNDLSTTSTSTDLDLEGKSVNEGGNQDLSEGSSRAALWTALVTSLVSALV